MNVAVADGSSVMREIVVRTVLDAGYEDWTVIEVANGREAYDLARSGRADLVLCDWDAPGMTGLEVVRELGAAGSRVPVGLVTSAGSAGMREIARAQGALFLLVRPFDATTFRATVDPFLL